MNPNPRMDEVGCAVRRIAPFVPEGGYRPRYGTGWASTLERAGGGIAVSLERARDGRRVDFLVPDDADPLDVVREALEASRG